MDDYLTEQLRKRNVRISKQGNICLDDFVDKVVLSRNPTGYFNTVHEKKIINGRYYITPCVCLDILKRGRSNECKKISMLLRTKETKNVDVFDPTKNLLIYNGITFTTFVIFDDNKCSSFWIKAAEVINFLGYNHVTGTLRRISDRNKITFDQIKDALEDTSQTIDLKKFSIDRHTNFINRDALVQLLCGSRKPLSIAFAKFLRIPMIIKKIFHETEICKCLIDFFETSGIAYSFQYSVDRYLVDCYLIDHNIAIEIDEQGHIDRCQKYEKLREKTICEKLRCSFLRCNPDDPTFSIFKFIGNVVNLINIHK